METRKMRALGVLITMGSFALTGLVVGNAYFQKKQFYPSVVYITKSNPSMAVLYIQAFVFVILFAKLMRKVFFGQLRAAEMEHLIERSWYAITETCLAFTVFRDDFSTRFVAMFTLLLFLKCFHWLAEDRVDYMESSPMISWLFHLRALGLLGILGALDMYFVNHAYYSTLMKGASVQLVFGFEYAILLTVMMTILVKYILHSIDLQSEHPWENKAVYLLYTELVMGFIKVILYSAFMVIMIKVHTFPLFAIRPMYLTLRSFKKALNDVIMSRRAIRNMNSLYPDATPEELQSGDNVCIICREEMTTNCKKLPCNHIFHTSCLRSWFQRQQTCPTCRMDVLRTPRPQTDQAQQQQPQQPQQPPQANVFPGFMGMGFPNFPHLPHGFHPHHPQMPQAPPPSSTAASGTGSTPSSTTTQVPPSAPSSTMPGTMPFFMPPFFNPMPFSIPPPMPPPNFQGLTHAELQMMEGQERQHVEARIQCLRNIQTLLDAAVIQMQQYSSLVNNMGMQPNLYNAPGSATTLTTSSPSADGSIPATQTTSQNPDTDVENLNFGNLQGAEGVTLPAENTPAEEEDSELSEIRRRRLDRFSVPGTAEDEQEC
ncbi:E3 ubiquitin-protein ligase synoviolin B-like [Lineus longissimus]|uniref:E3 ubiquitin-protein ligase synoviolin B-like n=1 Tax=Lineus longissimus TaxID=88925 RepID=UPI002B4E9D3C